MPPLEPPRVDATRLSPVVTPGQHDIDHGSDSPIERQAWSPTISWEDNGEDTLANMAGTSATIPSGGTAPVRDNSLLNLAFRQGNTIGSFFSSEERDAPTYREPGFNPWDTIKNTPYEANWQSFVNVHNAQHAEAVKRQIDMEREDRRLLEAYPWYQRIPAELMAGVLDLPTLIPGGAFVRSAQGSIAIGRTALNVALAGGVSSLAQETALQGSQETRTLGESAVNIGASVFLGGLLGAGGAKLLSRGEWFRAQRDLNRNLTLGQNIPGTPVDGRLLQGEISAQELADHFPGFEAYHGSPHDFDRFDMSRIGTGEGAQTYGHGLYFAENPAVAQQYVADFKNFDLYKQAGRDVARWADLASSTHANPSEAIQYLRSKLVDDPQLSLADRGHIQSAISILESGFQPRDANLYRVRIKENQERFLDWDKPLSEQSGHVQDTLRGLGFSEKDNNKIGGLIYESQRLVPGEFADKAAAAQRLREAGIPGIRYLDQGSRGLDGVAGTRNFVVFDDKLIEILDKNGKPIVLPDAGIGGVPTSAGAAATPNLSLDDLSIAGRAAGFVARMTQRFNPGLRLIHSPSAVVREAFLKTFDFPLYLKMHLEGRSVGPSAEKLSGLYNAGLARALQATDAAFPEYRKAGGQLKIAEFRQEVGKAMRRNDQADDPFISRVAQTWRKEVFDPLKDAAIRAGLLKEDVTVQEAASYFSRMWNRNRINAEESRFKGIIRHWVSNQLPGWADSFDRQTERRLDPIRREIDDLEMSKLRRAEDRRIRDQDGEIDAGDVNEADIRQALRVVQGGAPKPKGVQTLTQFVHSQGGLVDFSGELASMGINNRTRPGFVKKVRKRAQVEGGGWSFDDMARHAWENGYFPEHTERPTISDFLEALSDDFSKRRRVVRAEDREAFKLQEIIDRLEEDLGRLGIDSGSGRAPRFSTSEEVKGVVDRVYQALDTEADQRIAKLKQTLGERETVRAQERDARFLGEPDELGEQIANEVFRNVTGRGSTGVRPEFLTITARGPLKERTFHIPDLYEAPGLGSIEDFLEHDIDHVGRRYSRIMSADVELAHRHGSVDMDEQLAAIRDDYERLRQTVTDPKERQQLGKREERDINDLSQLRDLFRGSSIFAHPVERNWAAIARGFNHFNYLRSMGEVSIASLPETLRPAMVHGLLPYMQFVGQLATNLNAIKMSVRDARLGSTALDGILGHRLGTIAEITDPMASRGPIEAFLENMTNVANKWNGIRLLTDMQKSMSAVITQNRILGNVERYASIRDRERAYLAFLDIDQNMAGRIAEQFAQHGETLNGIRVANTEQWTRGLTGAALDRARVDVNTYYAAVAKDVDSIITTRGVADVPLLANTPTGKMLLQFKSFSLASHQRVLLRGLQEGQARFIGGLIAMTTIGMMTTYLKAISGNREEKLADFGANPGWWIGEGLDKAGIFAVPMELANMFEKGAGVNPIKSPIKLFDEGSRLSQRNQNRSEIGSLLGPTIGTGQDILTTMGIPKRAAKGEEITLGQRNAAERLVPFNSYLGFRQMLRYVINPQQ